MGFPQQSGLDVGVRWAVGRFGSGFDRIQNFVGGGNFRVIPERISIIRRKVPDFATLIKKKKKNILRVYTT